MEGCRCDKCKLGYKGCVRIDELLRIIEIVFSDIEYSIIKSPYGNHYEIRKQKQK